MLRAFLIHTKNGMYNMDVQVQGDGLTFRVGKDQHERSLMAVLTQDLQLPSRFVMEKLGRNQIKVQSHNASEDMLLNSGERVRLDGGVIEPFGVETISPNVSRVADVLYEDDHMLVVNKPANMIVYPGEESDKALTLAHLVAAHYETTGQAHKVRHVHRLDRDTTGAVLYAKHAYSARVLDHLLVTRQIRRTYLALVSGDFRRKVGTITAPIGRDRHVAGRYRISKTGKPATTHYRVLGTVAAGNTAVSLVQCQLETGRTHQIRVHMAENGHPVVGDTLYGAGSGIGHVEWRQGYALHASELALPHPYLRDEVCVEAPLTALFQQTLGVLQMDSLLQR